MTSKTNTPRLRATQLPLVIITWVNILACAIRMACVCMCVCMCGRCFLCRCCCSCQFCKSFYDRSISSSSSASLLSSVSASVCVSVWFWSSLRFARPVQLLALWLPHARHELRKKRMICVSFLLINTIFSKNLNMGDKHTSEHQLPHPYNHAHLNKYKQSLHHKYYMHTTYYNGCSW